VSLEQNLSYWRNKLASASKNLELPADYPRPLKKTHNYAIHKIGLPAELWRKIAEFADEQKTQPCNVLLTAFVLLLARYSRQDDITIGASQNLTIQPKGNRFEVVSVLHCELSGEPTFRVLLQQIILNLVDAESHAIAFESLVAALGASDFVDRNPIFQVLFGAQEYSPISWPNGTEDLDLAVVLHVQQNSIDLVFRYKPDLFDAPTVERLVSNFLTLIGSAVTRPDVNSFTLPMLEESERHRIVVEWNDTAVDYPSNMMLHQLVEQQAARTPDATAVISGSQYLTYWQLNQRANQLAKRLRKLGVVPDSFVGICAERSLEMVVALLGSMKAGGAYVPLDPEYPQDRIYNMLQDCSPKAVLTQAHLLARVPSTSVPVICLDKDWAQIEREDGTNLEIAMTGKNLVYCIYTSGSTGRPKGVPNFHQSIVNRLLWGQDTYRLEPSDRVLQKTPFSFDVSVWEFFWPLITGAVLVMARPGGHKDPDYLVQLIQEEQITTVHFVPSMLAIFLAADGVADCRSIRHVFAAGEALPFELQYRFFERLPVALHNLYGPTETAVEVTYWQCRRDYIRPIVPIGKPVANTQAYILDGHLQPVPIGIAGELHIGGVQVAQGYLNRPELTAEKFIHDPFCQEPDARLYKTGDLTRFLPDGNIEYIGRIDNQVKLRGFRIELGEIESVVCECPGVALAAVILREDIPGDKRLVGYLVSKSDDDLSVQNIRAHLLQKLPEFMVPSRFVILDQMPMTTSGKVDRRALPKPQERRDPTRDNVGARNELESTILPIFAKTLGVQSLGVQDDFFELGGHSLLAAHLVSEIKRVSGRHIPLSAMHHASTVETLAQFIASGETIRVDSVAMPIQVGTQRTVPLFAIVIPGVETLGYAALARHLGAQQSFYKIQRKECIPNAPPFLASELDDLIQEYVSALRSIQSEGPYCFIAMCDDVAITQEIILRLERDGQEVGFFAILDTWVAQNVLIPWKWRVNYYATRLRQTAQLPISDWAKTARAVLSPKVTRSERVRKSSIRPTWRQIYWPDPGFQPPIFHAPIVLFKRPKQPYYYIKDPFMGWGLRSLGGVEKHEMELDHENLLREPHIKAIGKILSVRLENTAKLSRGGSLMSHKIQSPA
jgi:amino acid adenylation domain-containing protein